MEKRIIGQSHALEAISQRIRTARAKLDDPRRPIGGVPAGRPERRRQDRDGADAGRHALRRRAEHGHHQHVGVSGGAHRLRAEGFAARLRRLRRGRRAHRGGAPQAVLRRAARRDREGPPRRAWSCSTRCSTRACWRTPRGARSTSRTPSSCMTSNVGTDTIMKLCADPETRPEPDGAGRGAAPRSAQGLQAGLSGPHDRGALLTRSPTTSCGRSSSCSSAGSAPGCRRTTGPSSPTTRPWSTAIAQPLHRGRERRPQRRPHPHPDAAAGDLAGVPGAHGRRRHGLQGARLRGRGWGVPLRDSLAGCRRTRFCPGCSRRFSKERGIQRAHRSAAGAPAAGGSPPMGFFQQPARQGAWCQ